MSDFVIFTDSSCDISPEILKEWNVGFVSLNYYFVGEAQNIAIDISDFYKRMRNGDVAKTSAANPEDFTAAFEKIMTDGKDILYLAFSSGLSNTYNSSRIAADDLLKKYPERKIICIDTLCASAGQGLIVYLTVQKKKELDDIEKLAGYVRNLIPHLCHWFTVDDLVYLKRGGRVSPTVAFVGSVLGIKPVLHVDDAGLLINVSKARGRKNSLIALAAKYGETALDPAGGTVFISQADCRDEAEFLSNELKKRYGVQVKLITDIGPVIGAHSGPGTMALFFVGSKR